MDEIWSLMFLGEFFCLGLPYRTLQRTAPAWQIGGPAADTYGRRVSVLLAYAAWFNCGQRVVILRLGEQNHQNPSLKASLKIMKPSLNHQKPHCNFGIPKILRQPQNCRFFLSGDN